MFMRRVVDHEPLANAFWNDKRVDMTKINIPCFITGSDFSQIHTMGAVRGWMQVNTDKKWIKWSGYQEWFELYSCPESNVELKVSACALDLHRLAIPIVLDNLC